MAVKRLLSSPMMPVKKSRFDEGAAEAVQHELPQGNIGEVRFASAEEAHTAVELLNGSELGGSAISLVVDAKSQDGSKVAVYGVPDGVSWEQLKEHCSGCGMVVFCGINTHGTKGGKGKGKGGGGNLSGGGQLSGGTLMGEVRFETAEDAAQAFPLVQGSTMDGINVITVQSQEGTTMFLTGIPAGCQWQELKDHCKQAGRVAFCAVEGDASGSGKGFKGYGMPKGQKGAGKGPAMQTHQGMAQPAMSQGGGSLVGEVRYADPNHAFQAMRELNGSVLDGSQIFIQADQNSQDGSKLIVNGIAPGTAWQELKDHFAAIGQVAFANVGAPAGGRPGVYMQVTHGKGTDSQAAGYAGHGGGGYGAGFGGGFGGGCAGGFGGRPAQIVPVTPRKGGYGGQELIGEIRYDNPQHAQDAVSRLNGSMLDGASLTVQLDGHSVDYSKVTVMGVPATIGWQELKDHFACVGQVAFANIRRC